MLVRKLWVLKRSAQKSVPLPLTPTQAIHSRHSQLLYYQLNFSTKVCHLNEGPGKTTVARDVHVTLWYKTDQYKYVHPAGRLHHQSQTGEH